MRLTQRLCLAAALLGCSLPNAKADADFQSVRETLLKDHSGKAGDPKEKFFHESTFHPHYDGRFAAKTMGNTERRINLTAMVKAYLATMNDLGAETWLMHGTLIGWWWNRKILPWDSDIDVQMTLDTMAFLANYYQLYVFHYSHPDIPGGRDYMLEINPDYFHNTESDKYNAIDARWIDMNTGLFIDITVVRPDVAARERGQPYALECKDRHHYNETDLFPLRDSTFEGIPVKIPFEYTWLLEEEYSAKALTREKWEGHAFNKESMEWTPMRGAVARLPNTRKGRPPVLP